MTNPDDALPMPVGDTPSRDEQMGHLRGVYSTVLSDIVDRCCSELLLPDDQAALCLDVAGMTAMLMAAKVVELRRKPMTRENLMAVWWPFQKSLKDDIPGKLRELADAVARAG